MSSVDGSGIELMHQVNSTANISDVEITHIYMTAMAKVWKRLF